MSTNGTEQILEIVATPDATNTRDLGTPTREYRDIYTRNITTSTNLNYADGTEGDGYMLMSDANGDASWMSPRMADCYWEDNATATDITVIGTFLKASVDASATTLNSGALGGWDLNAVENRLRYTGSRTGFAHIGCTMSIDGGNGQVYQAFVAKNGTKIAGSLIEIATSNATNEVSSAIHCMTDVSQNDYLELWITNTTSINNDPTVLHCNLFAMLMG